MFLYAMWVNAQIAYTHLTLYMPAYMLAHPLTACFTALRQKIDEAPTPYRYQSDSESGSDGEYLYMHRRRCGSGDNSTSNCSSNTSFMSNIGKIS
jgi:hypothetical protein